MLDLHAAGDGRLAEVLGEDWETLEDVSMLVAFGGVLTALDLCADAVLLVCREPVVNPKAPKAAPGSFYDLPHLRRLNGKPNVPPAIRKWADQLVAHPELATLRDWRHAVLRRHVRRHPMVAFSEGMPTRRAPSEVTALDSRSVVEGRAGKPIRGEIAHVVEFGEAQLESLCQAILSTDLGL